MLNKCIICGNEFEANSASNNICPSCRQAATGDPKPAVAKENIETQAPQIYKTTKCLLDELDKSGWNYRLVPHDDERPNDRVVVPMSAKNLPSVPVTIFFQPNEERVAMYVYNVYRVPEEKLPLIPALIDELHKQYVFARWIFDKSDNTIQAEWYGSVFGGEETGIICKSGIGRLSAIVDDCFPIIMQTMYALPNASNIVDTTPDTPKGNSTILS